jgi:hypothetical protein
MSPPVPPEKLLKKRPMEKAGDREGEMNSLHLQQDVPAQTRRNLDDEVRKPRAPIQRQSAAQAPPFYARFPGRGRPSRAPPP